MMPIPTNENDPSTMNEAAVAAFARDMSSPKNSARTASTTLCAWTICRDRPSCVRPHAMSPWQRRAGPACVERGVAARRPQR